MKHNTQDYGSAIVKNLEERDYTKDMMIGHLTGVLNGLKYLDDEQLNNFMDREIDYSKPIAFEAFKPSTSLY